MAAGQTLVPILAALLATVPALAQSPPGETDERQTALEEVVVTATKRGETLLQDTPFSIRALDEAVLRDKGVEDFADWAPLVPGLIAQDQGPGEKRFIIRGIQAVGPPTVGVYFDDAVISGFNPEDDGGGRNADIRLYDVERIEVLRGPQGTLYGAGSLSGTIRIITNKPDPQELYGSVGVGAASTHSGGTSFKASGFANIPLSDSTALRAVVWHEDEAGFIDNVRLGRDDINEENTTGGRVAVRWIADNLELNASAVVQRTDLDGKQRFFPSIGDLETDEFTVDTYEDDLELYQGAFTYQLENGSLHASTALFNRDVFFRFDSTPILLFFGVPLPFAIAVTDQPDNRELWSNEIRYASDFDSRFQMVVGAFYQELERDFASNVISASEDGIPNGTEPDIFGRVSSFQTDETAVFGEFSYEFTEKLTGVIGARWFDFEQDSQSRETLPFGGFDPGDEPPPDPNRMAAESDVTFKASLSYEIEDDITVYGLFSEGFREGGTNSTGFGNLIIIPEEFESDSIENYEVGAKTVWLDGRLAVNASVYTIDWSNIQTQEQEPVQGFNFIGNAGAAQVDGIELELFARPTEDFDIAVSAGYQDARLTEDQPVLEVETPVGRDGDAIPYVPEFTGAVSLQYRFPLGGFGWQAFVRSDWSYVGSSQTQFNMNGEFFHEQDSYDILDLRFVVENQSWEATFFLDNVFDERAELTIIENRAVPLSVFTNRPRTLGAAVNWRF